MSNTPEVVNEYEEVAHEHTEEAVPADMWIPDWTSDINEAPGSANMFIYDKVSGAKVQLTQRAPNVDMALQLLTMAAQGAIPDFAPEWSAVDPYDRRQKPAGTAASPPPPVVQAGPAAPGVPAPVEPVNVPVEASNKIVHELPVSVMLIEPQAGGRVRLAFKGPGDMYPRISTVRDPDWHLKYMGPLGWTLEHFKFPAEHSVNYIVEYVDSDRTSPKTGNPYKDLINVRAA